MNDSTPGLAPRFVTFEGGEGVGKSTQVRRLITRLNRNDVTAIRTREPGGTPKAEAIRSFVLQGHSEAWGAGAEAVLFAAARFDHVTRLIGPNLDAGRWVISDRFHDSTRAYQGLIGGVADRLVDALEVLALDGRMPDLTLVLDMDPEVAFRRIADREEEQGTPGAGDRFEKQELDWHRQLRQAFLDIAASNPARCVVIHADQTEDAMEQQIWETLTRRFPELPAGLPA